MELNEQRRALMIQAAQGFFMEEFEEDLSTFRAEQLLDFFLERLGPQAYNQGVQDARIFLQRKLDDLDGEVHEPDGL